MASLELVIWVVSEKARSVMNIDMVNPIPPKKLTPNKDFQLRSSGSELIFDLTERKLNSQIPKGFPIIKPRAIPIV